MEPTSGGGLVCGLAENEGAGVRTRARHTIGGSSSCAEAASAASRHRLVSMLATAVRPSAVSGDESVSVVRSALVSVLCSHRRHHDADQARASPGSAAVW